MPELSFATAAEGNTLSPWCLIPIALLFIAICLVRLDLSRERTARFVGTLVALIGGVAMMINVVVRMLA
ncbi:hypothetical protein AB0I28_35675 [Phytomonospora sp. NPDC050363]|uniref:hypothetical protein n=1 Tax=Phytomonospora sp. NPDC050363 TaxID=3155642 RepID=UPI0033DBF53B